MRAAIEGSEWQSAFAFETTCKTIEKNTDAYFEHLAGWTHTYVNFETPGAVEIEIAWAGDQPIRTAAVRPQRKADPFEKQITTNVGKLTEFHLGILYSI